MHGNYRHHYLLSAASTAAASSSTAQQQQQQAASAASSLSALPNKPSTARYSGSCNNFNGLPIVSNNGNNGNNGNAKINQSQILPGNYPSSQRSESQGFSNSRHFTDQRQVRAATVTATTGSRSEYCTKQQDSDGRQRAKQVQQQLIHMNNNNHLHHQMILPKQRDYQQHFDHQLDDALSNGHHQHQHQNQQDNYASQIRNSQLQHLFQQQQVSGQQQMQQHTRGSQVVAAAGPSGQHIHSPASSTSSQSSPKSSASSRTPVKSPAGATREEKPLHVNFNRGNHMTGEDEGDSRKKKYLTAKYGQQQMNLIKKRLKIEMWLCEQLQELAKGSKSEAELDEIDVDLDQLLDMDDDDTRRRWLKKTLEPFEDLPGERIDKFITDVLEQSKLL